MLHDLIDDWQLTIEELAYSPLLRENLVPTDYVGLSGDAKKRGQVVLVVNLESLERLEIGTDHGKTRDRDSLEGEEVQGVLAAEVPGYAGQTGHSL